jgi:predicted O-methyltransferase YrrM
MIFIRVFKYLKYILLSDNRKGHGIHSPFVYDLVSRIFRNKIDGDIVFRIEKIRKKLIADGRSIVVNDLGTGQERMKTNLRKVSGIAGNSPVPRKYGVLLSNLASEFGNPFIAELGTSFGISTMYMAAAKDTKVKTVEGSSVCANISIENFSEAGIDNIEVFTGPFAEILPLIINPDNKPGMVFIDGDHRKRPLLDYFYYIAGVCDSKSVIVIDDINYSEEMEEAWKEIKSYEKVTFTIDLFRMGMVFFREGMTHNDYIIRY